jgi:hypothetical protein
MARRTTPPPPERPVLTADQLRRRVERLQTCIQEIQALDLEKVQKRDGDPEVMRIEAVIDSALTAAFGSNTPSYMRYWNASQLDTGPRSARIEPMWGGGSSAHYDAQDALEARRYLAEGKLRSMALLQSAIGELEAEIADRGPSSVAAAPQEPGRQRDLSKVFIVHGHDEGPREAVRSFLLRLGFEPIVLHDQPNKGLLAAA